MVQAAVYTATASQFASATSHLETRNEWSTIRVDGIRYVVLVSGNSGRVYWVRADAGIGSCRCLWSEKASTPCSHRVALELDATEQELAEAPLMANLYRRCARVGCGEICESRVCDDCAALAERSERMAAARASVLEGWTA